MGAVAALDLGCPDDDGSAATLSSFLAAGTGDGISVRSFPDSLCVCPQINVAPPHPEPGPSPVSQPAASSGTTVSRLSVPSLPRTSLPLHAAD